MFSAPDRNVFARRTLLVFLALSAAVHATLLALLPGWAPENVEPAASRLEVIIVEPTPLLPESIAAARPARAAARGRTLLERATSEPLGWPLEEIAPSPAAMDDPEPRASAPERLPQSAAAPAVQPVQRAGYLRSPAPRYPDVSRRAGEQGTVTLRVRVAADGSPSRVTVEKSSGSPHLDAAALDAVKGWRFSPARQGTEAVESWMLVPVVFRLEGSG